MVMGFVAITMRCNEEQYKKIKHILLNHGCTLNNVYNWGLNDYLTNNICGDKKHIGNMPEDDSLQNAKSYKRKIYMTWDEEIFLKSCGINLVNKNKWWWQI